jgi:hypothetical protein
VAVDGLFTDSRLTGDTGRGFNRNLPHLGDTGKGVHLTEWFSTLSARLANTRVACGDWTRVCGPSVLQSAGGVCGVFLDPPYSLEMRTAVYAEESDCAADVLAWCKARTNDPDLRIVLAGYDGEHNALEAMGWRVKAWKAHGGYGSQGDTTGRANAAKERLWFSPQCVEQPARQGILL